MNENQLAFPERASGRTTRIIDGLIQKLYKHYKQWIFIVDHDPQTIRNFRYVCDKVVKRMALEHPNDVIETDFTGKTPRIKLSKCSVLDYKMSIEAEIEYKKQIKSNLDRLNKLNDGIFSKVIDKIS